MSEDLPSMVQKTNDYIGEQISRLGTQSFGSILQPRTANEVVNSKREARALSESSNRVGEFDYMVLVCVKRSRM